MGQISGTVTDPDGALVAGAEVIVANTDTGVKFQTVTTNSGRFVVPLLPPGNYQLSVSLAGFQTYQRTGLTVRTSESITLEVGLRIGELSSVVTVSGGAPLLLTKKIWRRPMRLESHNNL